MRLRTETGSMYELDLAGSAVRRLVGVKDPTVRQGPDGEWCRFDHLLASPAVGRPLVIVWSVSTDRPVTLRRTTTTSRVVELDPSVG